MSLENLEGIIVFWLFWLVSLATNPRRKKSHLFSLLFSYPLLFSLFFFSILYRSILSLSVTAL